MAAGARAFRGAALGGAAAFLLGACSDYPVEVDALGQLTGVWSDYAGRTVEFKGDGSFTAEGLDKAMVGLSCDGVAGRQRGVVDLQGSYAEVTFDGVECDGLNLTFHGSPTSFVFCFTQDMTAGGCAGEFSRKSAESGR